MAKQRSSNLATHKAISLSLPYLLYREIVTLARVKNISRDALIVAMLETGLPRYEIEAIAQQELVGAAKQTARALSLEELAQRFDLIAEEKGHEKSDRTGSGDPVRSLTE